VLGHPPQVIRDAAPDAGFCGVVVARIAADVIDAVEGRLPLREAMLVDLACGTGSAALAAASRGARVTTVDFTPNLIAIGAHRADVAGRSLTWVTADASDTGLPRPVIRRSGLEYGDHIR